MLGHLHNVDEFNDIYSKEELDHIKQQRADTIRFNRELCEGIDKRLNYLKSIGELPEDEPIESIRQKLYIAKLNAMAIDREEKIKEVIRMADNTKFGVITEQGYPMDGQYGYKPLNEEDNRKILEENAKKESEKKNEKGE